MMESHPMSTAAAPRARASSLWRHADFLKLWSGQTISIFGTLVTRFALPLIAALMLGAGPAQMALLSAAEILPGLVLGFFVGVLVDRLRRRPMLIAVDLGRALVLGSIPVAALLGSLHLLQVYLVALTVSVLNVCFTVAYPAYLPTLIRREQLVEGNAMLEASASVAEVAGWSVAGMLVQVFSAPLAILVDSATFLVSACSILAVRAREPRPAPPNERLHVGREALHGLRFTVSDPTRRALVGAGALDELFGNALGVVIVLYLVRDLHLPPALMGATFAVGGVSAFCGATLAAPVTRRLGLGRTMLLVAILDAPFAFFIPLASGPVFVVSLLLVMAQLGDGLRTLYQINRLSLLQAVTPARLQGRLHATIAVLEGAATLGGILLGGALGTAIGLRPTLFVACTGHLLGLLWLTLSPVRRLRELPSQPQDVVAPASAVSV
jgi:MFS family permease